MLLPTRMAAIGSRTRRTAALCLAAHPTSLADRPIPLAASSPTSGSRQVACQPFADRLGVATQLAAKPLAAAFEQLGIQRLEADCSRQRHQPVPPGPADQTLDLALVVALARTAEPIG